MMTSTRTCKGRMVTGNFTSHGPLVSYLKEASVEVIAVQEHRAVESRMAAVQSRVADAGYHGLWAPALDTEAGDSSGGVAVLAKSNIMVTAPPGRSDHVLEPGRMVAAHVHYGVAGGLVVVAVYLRVGEGMSAENLAITWKLCEYLMELNCKGYAWVVGGDFNMELSTLDAVGWLGKARGYALVPAATTCRKTLPGTRIDYWLLSQVLATRFEQKAVVDEEVTTYPHLPVEVSLLTEPHIAWCRVMDVPRELPKELRPGCASYPWDWKAIRPCIHGANSPEGLSVAWDLLVEGVEQEVMLRHDIVGAAQRPYAGRAGQARTRWVKLQWKPPHRVPGRDPRVKALILAGKWANRYFERGKGIF